MSIQAVRRRTLATLGLCLIVLLAAGDDAGASTVLPLDLTQLTDRSQRIFHGTCVEAHAQLAAGEVVTRLRFAVTEGLKGTGAADTLTFVVPGGSIDGQHFEISGMPVFAAGDEVVLFLSEPDAAGRVWPTGLAQGGFRVIRAVDAPPRVRRSHDGLLFWRGSARAAAPSVPDLSLDQLLDEVRSRAGSNGDQGSVR